MFLSIDGCDGTGKSTQLTMLVDWLRAQGHDVVTCRDPGSTALGESVRELLLHRDDLQIDRTAEMLLYMAARAQLAAEVIRPAIQAGRTVVSDRYLLANVVYQGYGGQLDVEALWQVGCVATGGLMPDLTLILDVPPEVAAQRVRSDRAPDRMESQSAEFHRRVRDGFLAEAERCPGQMIVVDATPDVEQVHQRITQAVGEMLDRTDSNSIPTHRD